MEQRLAGPPGGGGSAGSRHRLSGRPRSFPVAWRPGHYQSGGHGIRTHNSFRSTTFPVWPLTIRLPSKHGKNCDFSRLATLLGNFRVTRRPQPSPNRSTSIPGPESRSTLVFRRRSRGLCNRQPQPRRTGTLVATGLPLPSTEGAYGRGAVHYVLASPKEADGLAGRPTPARSWLAPPRVMAPPARSQSLHARARRACRESTRLPTARRV